MIVRGEMARVKTGPYAGQTVEVLSIDGRRMRGVRKRGYKLNTRHGELQSPSYYSEVEIEVLKNDRPDGSN